MENIADQQQVSSEISSAISNPINFSANYDKNELLQELEELENQELENKLMKISAAPSTNLPTTSNKVTPSAAKTSKKHDDEDELEKMAAWANS